MNSVSLLKYKTHQIFFLLFVISVGFQKSNYLIDIYTGFDLQNFLGISLLLFPLIFLILTVYFSQKTLSIFKLFEVDYLLTITIILVHLNFLMGYFMGNDFDVIIQEYWTGLIVFLAYQISYNNEIIKIFQQKPIYYIFFVFAGLTILGTFHLQKQFISIVEANPSLYFINTASVAYDMSPILDIWVFLFLIPFYNSKKINRFYIYAPILIYIIFQFYFLKRAPSVRALIYLILAWNIYVIKYKKTNFLIRSIFIIILISLITYFIVPQELLDRFASVDVARQDEAIQMIEQLTTLELVFGRGLGGFFTLESGAALIDVNEIGVKGKHILHIGILYPILKGGVVLAVVVYLHVFSAIRNALISFDKLNNYQLASLTFLLVYSLFRLIEGPFSPGLIFDSFFFGFSIGLLKQKNNYYNA